MTPKGGSPARGQRAATRRLAGVAARRRRLSLSAVARRGTGHGREDRPRRPLPGAGKAIPARYPGRVRDRPRSARALTAVAVGTAGQGGGPGRRECHWRCPAFHVIVAVIAPVPI
jgi:hypothetical protein